MNIRNLSIKKVIMTLIMLFCSIVFLLPFAWMISTSFKLEVDVFKYPIEWIPKRWNAINNYSEVWLGKYPFYRYYWNSIKVAVSTTLVSVTVSAMARSEEHTSELQSRGHLVCRLLLEKKQI